MSEIGSAIDNLMLAGRARLGGVDLAGAAGPSSIELQVSKIVRHWQDVPDRIPFYEAASWGPAEADQLLARDGREWHNS